MLITVLIPSAFAFAWFSDGDNRVSTGGMSVIVRGRGLEIRKEENGENIGVDRDSEIKDYLANHINNSEQKIRPASSGYFEFYVYNSVEENYSFSFTASVIDNTGVSENEGVFSDSEQTNGRDALQYINSHILFFLEKTESCYAKVILPETSSEIVVTGGAPCLVRIYWVWLLHYEQIFSADGDLTDADSRIALATYYSAHPEKMFVGGKIGEEEYNQADYIIGTTIKRMRFHLDVLEN